MKKYSAIFILFTVFLFFTCTKKDEVIKTDVQKKDTVSKTVAKDTIISFDKKNIFRSYNQCDTTDPNCSYILINYIEMKDSPLKDKFNGYIQRILKDSLYNTGIKIYKDLNELAKYFIDDYTDFKKLSPNTAINFYLRADVSIKTNTPEILSVEISSDQYAGGAHGISFLRYLNFNAKTFDRLRLSQLLSPGFEEKINKLIDIKFREKKNLKPGDDLGKKGGLFINEIKYNDNFLVSNDGLEFYYSPYEIAPYSEGTIELKIKYSEIEDLIPQAGILKNIIK